MQLLHCGIDRPERRLEPTTAVAGLQVAGLGDPLAMKLNAIAGRGQLRDYYDLMAIEQHGGRSVEEGLALYLARDAVCGYWRRRQPQIVAALDRHGITRLPGD